MTQEQAQIKRAIVVSPSGESLELVKSCRWRKKKQDGESRAEMLWMG